MFRLIRLTIVFPIQRVALSSIHELEQPFWFQDGAVPSCRAVADHARLISETDLRYPIILSSDGRVMDGMHRVTKAYLEGREWIDAVQFRHDPDPDYIDRDLDTLPHDDAPPRKE